MLEAGIGLHPLQLDLELGPPGGRLGIHELGGVDSEGVGELGDVAQLRLAPAVLQHREIRGRSADPIPELLQRQARRLAMMAETTTEREGVDGDRGHSHMLTTQEVVENRVCNPALSRKTIEYYLNVKDA